MTFPRTIAGFGWSTGDNDDSNSGNIQYRKIIVANFLPLVQRKHEESGKWDFKWDEDSLLLQMKDGVSTDAEVIYVGRLKVDIDHNEQDEIARNLFNVFKCIPTFLPSDLQRKFYHGFCKQQLWPLFHSMLPVFHNQYELIDPSLFSAYISANNIFADKVVEAIRSENDCVWVHDYHLMLLPTFLRKKAKNVKLGFFLHSPFPSSEIYKTLPQREDILKGLLNADLIGFHTFEYARHFLSCCSRMLGFNYECNRGYLELEYFGRTVSIKVLSIGVHIGRIQLVLNLPITISKVQEIEQKFKGKKLILGVDDLDIFKGISLKLEGFELFLERNPALRGQIVLVQIINPARSTGKNYTEARIEAMKTAERINITYGNEDYKPLILVDKALQSFEKFAYYVVADCCIVNAFRDGMNLVPYEYVVCRQGTETMDRCRGIKLGSRRSSPLIVSEFIGCSPSLSGALRVNPWNVEEIQEALHRSIFMPKSQKQLRHHRHYNYVSSHDIAYWSNSFIQDLERACKNHKARTCWPLGLGLNFRILALDHSFQRLCIDHVLLSYQRANRRAIFLDYDGTLVPNNSTSKDPSTNLISILNRLCSDSKNTVLIVSGRDRSSLGEWFSSCEAIGIAAEHGFFIRWNKASEWESSSVSVDFEWKEIAEPVMKLYTEATDGSYIESKESAIVWHHQYADSYFGPFQANELLDHLESVLADEPVSVKKGEHIVEVKPQGVSKGMVVEKLLRRLVTDQKTPDFVLCIGDDKSDEDMFESINECTTSADMFTATPEVFACTIGQKPSKAKYFVEETSDVDLLEGWRFAR
ncbi:probable alpha,alpha-trehalose-phosphate synthase [UDP-forming] 9 [Asparagus officinalis]|nr:probable alpha,alpha-trehalose-phosphate synthase [UDP-forming] 9 [Asparagus officinalis]